MRTVIINGIGRSGKDTFVDYCCNYAICECISSVDYVKEIAKKVGWDGRKDEASRKFLSDLKDLLTEYSDYPMQTVRDYRNYLLDPPVGCCSPEVLFVMIREPDEIQRAAREFGAVTLLINRPDVIPIESNHADANVMQYDYDYTVVNNGTLDDFEKQAAAFIVYLLSGALGGDDV